MRARCGIFALLCLLGACGGPVRKPAPPSGELIAMGGGPGGAHDACFTCHGFRGEGLDDAPRLAGLDRGYLLKQLFDYAQERRQDPIMSPIAARLSARDMQVVANHYAAMQAAAPVESLPALYLHGDAARGLRACADCHGRDASGIGAGNPALARQPARYTAEQLARWKRGERRNDPRDVMGLSARQLTDEEIVTLARYLEGSSRER